MDLDTETSLTVSVATFLILPILWIKVQRSKRIQEEYKRGIIMGLILLFALVILCTNAYTTEFEYYTDMFQLAQLLVCVLLFILVTRAYWKERMYKLGIMIPIAVIILAFVTFFARESIPKYSPDFNAFHPPSPSAPMGYLPSMHMPSAPLVNQLNNIKIFNIKKLTSQVGITVFAVLCVCLGV